MFPGVILAQLYYRNSLRVARQVVVGALDPKLVTPRVVLGINLLRHTDYPAYNLLNSQASFKVVEFKLVKHLQVLFERVES